MANAAYHPELMQGKTVLITGGGSGLGLGMAKGVIRHGGNIAICGRTESKLQNAIKELEAKATGGARASYYVCDVRDYEAVGQMLDAIEKDYGQLDGLVNNAAGNFLAASEDLTPNGFRTVVDIVLQGSFNCTQQLGARWIEKGQKGSIVSIVTTYTQSGCAFVLPSACAKAGVEAMMNSLAFEWGPHGIRLNSIAPGPFPTEGAWSRLVPDPSFNETMQKRNPLQRFGEPEELADLALYLLSDLSAYMSGSVIAIDGAERHQGAQFNAITELFPREQLKQVFRAMKESRKS
ncbi:MAG: SDR family oxidoreductase [Bacteroidota bacterium]